MVAEQFMHAQSGVASSISENVRFTDGQFHMIFNYTATYKLCSKVIFYQAYLNNFDFFKKNLYTNKMTVKCSENVNLHTFC